MGNQPFGFRNGFSCTQCNLSKHCSRCEHHFEVRGKFGNRQISGLQILKMHSIEINPIYCSNSCRKSLLMIGICCFCKSYTKNRNPSFQLLTMRAKKSLGTYTKRRQAVWCSVPNTVQCEIWDDIQRQFGSLLRSTKKWRQC